MNEAFKKWRVELLSSGLITPLAMGASQEEVTALFGSPDRTSTETKKGKALVFRYTDIIVLALFSLTSVSLAEDISRNPSVSLGDETLFLASVEAGPDVVLNEYIRKTETFENWKVLFAVRYVRSAKNVGEVVERWKAYIAQVRSPGKSMKEEGDSTTSDRRFILSIRPLGDAYLENNQLRFVPGPGGKGVIYYQAAVRMNPRDESDIMQGLLKGVSFADALKALTLQAIEKMPISEPAQTTPVSALR